MMESVLLGAGVVAGIFADGVHGERYSAYPPALIYADDMDNLVDRAKRIP